MATRFDLGYRAWPILTDKARAKATITYEELATALGYKNARAMRFALWPLQDFCMEKDLPPLTSLVVNKRTGRPGSGFIAWDGDPKEAQRRVFSFPWASIPRPFPPGTSITLPVSKTKRQGNRRHSYEVPDIEVIVNGRGPYQAKFRARLMKLYKRRCALCDTKYSGLLVAAHILPWSKDSRHRLDPANGLLLCRSHDALFDSGIIRISPGLNVQIAGDATPMGSTVKVLLDKHTLARPTCPSGALAPNPAFLKWRFERVEAYKAL